MKLTFLVVALILLCSPGVARSQVAMSPQKSELIDRLVVATGANKNVGIIFEAFMNAYILMMPPFDESSFKFAQSPEFRKELVALGNRTMKATANRTKERVLEDNALRTEQLNIVTKIWNETFSEDDLKALLVFYESPVGKKIVQLGPAIAIETSRRAPEILEPIVSHIYDEVQREEMEKAGKEVMELERKYKIGKKPR